MSPANSIEEKDLRYIRPILDSLNKKGVVVKLALNGQADNIKNLFGNSKLDAKNIGLNANFCIADSKHLMFMLDSEDTAIWVKSEFLTSAIKQLFDNSWKGK